jgi:hypothetical protein
MLTAVAYVATAASSSSRQQARWRKCTVQQSLSRA